MAKIDIKVGTPTDPPSNEPPTNTVPGTQTAYRNTLLEFSEDHYNKISITNSDVGDALMYLRIIPTNGWVSLGRYFGPCVGI